MKKRRLMIQVSVLVFVFYVLAGVLGTILVYKSATRTYLTAKDDMISRDIKKIKKETAGFVASNWLLDYAPNHVEEISSNYKFAGSGTWEAFIERMPDTDFSYNNEQVYDAIEKGANEEEKADIAAETYSTISFALNCDLIDLGYGNVFLIGAGEDLGFVYYQAEEYDTIDDALYEEKPPKNDPMELGYVIDYDLEEHPGLKEAMAAATDDVIFETYTGSIGKLGFENHYTAYCPIIYKGKVQAIMVLDYNWDEFRRELNSEIQLMISLMAAGMILSCAIAILLISRVAVRPLAQLQSAVNEYGKTKDSAKAVENIGRIKSGNEIGMLAQDVSALTVEIESYVRENMKLVGERERVAAEMDLARKIQADMLPSAYPAFPNRKEFDIYATMTPAKEVGGDFYDYFLIDDDHLAMVIADVSGKGVPAAMFMMMSKILIQNFAQMGLPPAKVIEKANDVVCQNNEEEMFVTAWYGVMEISTGKVIAVNAGHECPIIRKPDGDFELIKDKHGFVIGGMPGSRYKEYELYLEKGGTLFVFTDGVTEATAADEEMFGTERLLETLNKNRKAMPVELLQEVKADIDAFVGEADQFDDLTMLGITLV